MRHQKYPRIWKNKKSKQKVRVMPWWEIVNDGKVVEVDELGQAITQSANRPCKFGIIYQVGYLIENQHGIWLGLGPQAEKEFKDLGEWKKEMREYKK